MLSKTKLYRGQHGKCGSFFIEHLIKSLPSNRNKYNHFTLAIRSFSVWPLEPSSTLGERWLPMVPPATLGGGQAQILATILRLVYDCVTATSSSPFAPKICFWLALRYRSTKELRYLGWNSSNIFWSQGFCWVCYPVCSGGLGYFFLDLRSPWKGLCCHLILFKKRLQLKVIVPLWICWLWVLGTHTDIPCDQGYRTPKGSFSNRQVNVEVYS